MMGGGTPQQPAGGTWPATPPPPPPPPGLPARRRLSPAVWTWIGVGALVVVLAVVVFLVVGGRSDGGFAGDWTAVDNVDGSRMTLTVTEEGGGFSLELHDERVSVICPGEAATTAGSGTVQGDTLVASMSGSCASGAPFEAGQITFTLDAERDVLTDSVNPGTVWERA